MNKNTTEQETNQTPAPETREWLIKYTRQVLMKLTEEERNSIMAEYD